MKEVWRPISIMPHYAVSSRGRVKALSRKVRFVSKLGGEFYRNKKERLCQPNKQNGGYLITHLYLDDNRTSKTIHSLVARAFIGPRPKGYDICHRNGIRTDNRVENLRYDTRSNNFKDMHRHGTYYQRIANSKLTSTDVINIRKLRGKMSAKRLAEKYRLSSGEIILRVWRRKSFAHVK